MFWYYCSTFRLYWRVILHLPPCCSHNAKPSFTPSLWTFVLFCNVTAETNYEDENITKPGSVLQWSLQHLPLTSRGRTRATRLGLTWCCGIWIPTRCFHLHTCSGPVTMGSAWIYSYLLLWSVFSLQTQTGAVITLRPKRNQPHGRS